jgi:hypothetical protein
MGFSPTLVNGTLYFESPYFSYATPVRPNMWHDTMLCVYFCLKSYAVKGTGA